MKTLAATRALAAAGRLYPSVILYGGTIESRQRAALTLASALLCEHPGTDGGCLADGVGDGEAGAGTPCLHCRRLRWPENGQDRFHPDFHVLERDLRTATSVEATKDFLRAAWSAPFEARGQVFVVAEAETLSGGAADSLLKLLEEPPARTPRHFLLLAASRLDLLPTLRSRSLSLFLGGLEALPEDQLTAVGDSLATALDLHLRTPSPIHLFGTAAALGRADGWDDPRARRPWAIGAAAILRYLDQRPVAVRHRRSLLALAEDLIEAPSMRLRGIPHTRILEGLVSRRLA